MFACSTNTGAYHVRMVIKQKRQELIANAKHVVIKLGTQLLADDQGKICINIIQDFAMQIAQLMADGKQVTLVSSGAVGAGISELKLKQKPTDIGILQAIAAVGQRCLMDMMAQSFEKYNIRVGQLLMTRSDFDDRTRYLNFRNCVTHLQGLRCLPIINENDTVAIEELRFGDNDQLAALTCHALKADCLILLTVVDGLLDDQGNRIPVVENIDEAQKHVRDESSAMGTGGMASKLQSVGMVTKAGEAGIIASGRQKNVLRNIFDAQDVGTLFLPHPNQEKLNSKRRWIGIAKRTAGYVEIDAGAQNALLNHGKSLLAIGVTKTHGNYIAGDLIAINDTQGKELARGLSNYSASEMDLVKGKRTKEIPALLGLKAYDEAVHRDHLVITNK